ncbi:retron St85 family RNA-directed DNA polymerase [Rhodovibrio salinarum]|uniref:RNA-directed DNA polymerase n=1 Tax=Rhodovibrio salinarum TaxID=1087 RepID=A0A934UYZ2_9PROT|nr:retron St85 family RNA-directed DNA polymerase [Rhodovibrio salinarum]MBK1695936.1 RNA-directed DNA polymerase [Rhodovibrio salinarum]
MRTHRDLASSWAAYEAAFIIEARRRGYSDDDVRTCLSYAKKLHLSNLPVIYDQAHFSDRVGYDISYIRRASNDPEHFYRTFNVPKKSGGVRQINEPLPSLKEIQRWILDNILGAMSVNPCAKAFVVGRDVRDNARFHRNQRIVINVDVKDFFPSITHRQIRMIFLKAGYSPEVGELLTQLCCLDGVLPQGAPTSPYISNLVCRPLDERLFGYAKKNGLRYTRYSDDISVSGDMEPAEVLQFVKKVCREHGFKIHPDKIRVLGPGRQKRVTGIVVNKHLQVPRKKRRVLRQSVYYIKKFGLDEHLSKTKNNRRNFLDHLMGQVNYVLFVNPKDREAQDWLRQLREIKNGAIDYRD